MSNIYYSPEDYGLEIFDEIEEADYSFNIFVVWKDKDGKLFYAQDSGCSCPSPFEDDNLFTLSPLNSQTFEDFEKEVHAWNVEYGGLRVELSEKNNFIKKAKEHLNI